MSLDRRDAILVKKLIKEIADIETIVGSIDEPVFLQSMVLQKAVVMSMINIGELSKKLSETILNAMASVPWERIRGLRNLAAHQYGDVNMGRVWGIIVHDIPELKSTLIVQQANFSA